MMIMVEHFGYEHGTLQSLDIRTPQWSTTLTSSCHPSQKIRRRDSTISNLTEHTTSDRGPDVTSSRGILVVPAEGPDPSVAPSLDLIHSGVYCLSCAVLVRKAYELLYPSSGSAL